MNCMHDRLIPVEGHGCLGQSRLSRWKWNLNTFYRTIWLEVLLGWNDNDADANLPRSIERVTEYR